MKMGSKIQFIGALSTTAVLLSCSPPDPMELCSQSLEAMSDVIYGEKSKTIVCVPGRERESSYCVERAEIKRSFVLTGGRAAEAKGVYTCVAKGPEVVVAGIPARIIRFSFKLAIMSN